MDNKPIKLKVKVKKSEIVRLQPNATKLVRRLQAECGMSASELVSQIICEAVTTRGIELEYEPVEDDEYVQMF